MLDGAALAALGAVMLDGAALAAPALGRPSGPRVYLCQRYAALDPRNLTRSIQKVRIGAMFSGAENGGTAQPSGRA
ncbi:hypothetical protein [Polyangium mundeleinium]|uniref:Uncharacterized protein n=1 Tax=Polyangium mundeleinium TaxID=2995306 RepID=A0ABT5EPH4_9BACT|nr:hypothetical protein [Polyangium mundeleinium]MDC0743257.1 hypothetical protein [Polyangium mundeleinium]